MISAYLGPFANHLWQSTLFAVAVWLVTLALRKNRAVVRHRLWLAASVKFLVPFSPLVDIGTYIERATAVVTAPYSFSTALEAMNHTLEASHLLLVPVDATPALQEGSLLTFFLGLWICGVAVSVAWWFIRWRQLHQIGRRATPLDFNVTIPVLCCREQLEPGVFGIFRPVLLLPKGITDRLSPAEVQAVLAHEVCHVRRRDNLVAAMHLSVETLFWFHPLVWWIKIRLIDEQERACDEEVLGLGTDPQAYAESILKICRFCLTSPLTCVSGLMGSNLKRRIEDIMKNRVAQKLSVGRMLLLGCAAITALAGPMASGIVNAKALRAQTQGVSLRAPTVQSELALSHLAGPAASLLGAQNPNISSNDPLILSDTYGYNFEPYMKEITDRVRMRWYSGIPDSARKGEAGRVVVVFTVLRDGTSQDVRLAPKSGTESLDLAPIAAIKSSDPFPRLPADFRGDRIVVQFTFLYNTR